MTKVSGLNISDTHIIRPSVGNPHAEAGYQEKILNKFIEFMQKSFTRNVAPFNGPVEIGLRALSILNEAFPEVYPLQRLVVFNYLVVHSDDLTGGPSGFHPKIPHRSGEFLVRCNVLHRGLLLYQSRDLVERRFDHSGVFFSATEYALILRQKARCLIEQCGALSDAQLEVLVRENIGEWGEEFEMKSVLWEGEME